MKKKYFYSHIVETSILSLELGEMDLSKEERIHLLFLAELQLHHVIVDAILSELEGEDKKRFLAHLFSDNHDKIWELLHKRIKNIEEKIISVTEELKKELHKDVVEAKTKQH